MAKRGPRRNSAKTAAWEEVLGPGVVLPKISGRGGNISVNAGSGTRSAGGVRQHPLDIVLGNGLMQQKPSNITPIPTKENLLISETPPDALPQNKNIHKPTTTKTSQPSKHVSQSPTTAAGQASSRLSDAELEKYKKMVLYVKKNPWVFGEKTFGVELWRKQKEIFESVWENRYTAVKSCFASGKCLSYGERVMLMDGSVVNVEELIGKAFEIPSFDEKTAEIVPAMAYATYNGEEPVYEIETRHGRKIRRTGNHPLYVGLPEKVHFATGDQTHVDVLGWYPIENIEPGYVVLAPKSIPVQATEAREEDEIKLLGYLLGDGGTTVGVTFSQEPGPAKDEFVEIVERYGCFVEPAGEYGLRVRGHKAPNGKRYASQHHTNHVLDLVRKWGLFGKRAYEKRFLDFVWKLPDEQLALLLNRLFACAGWAYAKERDPNKPKSGHQVQIAIASASEGLIEDVYLAMLRLGIVGSVRHRYAKTAGNVYGAWEWTITDAENINRFAQTVGIFGKESAVAEAVRVANLKRKTTNWLDVMAPEGFTWEVVKSVKFIGTKPTVNISVPGTHTFVTQLVEHNSFVAADIALTFAHLNKDSIVVITAPTDRQLRWGVMQNIARMYETARAELGSELFTREVRLGAGWYITAFATDDPGNIQGLHPPSGKLLLIVDESGAVKAPIHKRLDEALMTSSGARRLDIGNPLDPEGPFFDMFKNPNYHKITISAFDTPNLRYKDPSKHVPGLIDRVYVEERRLEWGEDSPMWKSRVLGEFPDSAEDTLIPISWVELAQERWKDFQEITKEEKLKRGIDLTPFYGLDVSRGGENETVLIMRDGNYVYPAKAWSNKTTTETANMVAQIVPSGVTVNIDDVGIGGGVTDQAGAAGFKGRGINVSMPATDARFLNLRAQFYWALRDALNPEKTFQLALPPDDKLAGQLTSIKYKMNAANKIQIESKEDMRRRGMKSPDRADALMLTFATNMYGADVAPVMVGGASMEEGVESRYIKHGFGRDSVFNDDLGGWGDLAAI